MAQKTLKNAVIQIKDGGSNTLTLKIGEGDFTWSEKRNIEYTLNGGNVDEVREGDDIPMEVSFDAILDYVIGSTGSAGAAVSISDALRGINTASGWTSTDSDACRPFAVDLVVVDTPNPTSCGDTETITFSDFRVESLDYSLDNGTIAASGKCNVTIATAVRS